MKKIFILTLFLSFLFNVCFGQPQSTIEYKNQVFRFAVRVPEDWKLFGQVINDSVNHRAIVDWGLPPIYSQLEKTQIENSISNTAYNKTNINSVDDLILSEYLRLDPTKNAMEVDSTDKNARIIYRTIRGVDYKGKSYFLFKDGTGYVINFMATPGTYDQNLAAFERFYKSITLL